MQVLTWLDLDTTDQEHRRCLQCDTVVGAALQPAGLSALEAQGYEVRDPAAKRPGCGCAAGGCGRRQVLD